MQKLLIGIMALGIIITTSFTYSSLSTSKQHIKEIETSLASTTVTLESTIFEKNELLQKLDQKTVEFDELYAKYRKLDKKTDELEKLAKTDKELLEKYSKVYFLNEHYVPVKLTDIPVEYLSEGKKDIQIHSKVFPFLKDLINDAKQDDVIITVTSGFRSFETQKDVKSSYSVIYGAGTANQFSADQGYSEHQLGTTVDFSTPGSGLTISFENTEAFKWLVDNAYKYGFVLSYPKGNSYYQYEPWHWRFVGKDLARKLYKDEEHFYDMDQRDINKYIVELFD